MVEEKRRDPTVMGRGCKYQPGRKGPDSNLFQADNKILTAIDQNQKAAVGFS